MEHWTVKHIGRVLNKRNRSKQSLNPTIIICIIVKSIIVFVSLFQADKDLRRTKPITAVPILLALNMVQQSRWSLYTRTQSRYRLVNEAHKNQSLCFTPPCFFTFFIFSSSNVFVKALLTQIFAQASHRGLLAVFQLASNDTTACEVAFYIARIHCYFTRPKCCPRSIILETTSLSLENVTYDKRLGGFPLGQSMF